MRKINVHPILFALAPVLSLYVENANQIGFEEVYWSLLIVVVFAILVWVLVRAVVRDPIKADIIASMFLILFFSFGNVMISISGLVLLSKGSFGLKYFFDSREGAALWLVFWTFLFVLVSALFLKTKLGKLQIERAEAGVSGVTHLRFVDIKCFEIPVINDADVSDYEKNLKNVLRRYERFLSDKNDIIDGLTSEGYSRQEAAKKSDSDFEQRYSKLKEYLEGHVKELEEFLIS